MIGKIERINLREVWKHEAKDFTQWLQENIDVLSDALPFDLSNAEREHQTGSLSVDLLAEDDSGNPVVIENQLEKSDHDHLGKLLTYLTTIDAKTAIWLTPDPRPEHIAAITWLNESSGGDFYLLKLEAVRIADSPPAALLTTIVGPSEESKQVGQTKKEIAERYRIRQRFWTGLLEVAKSKTKLHSNISPGQHSWIGAGTGKRGLGLNYGIRQHGGQIELYIDRGKDKDDENKAIFDQLIKHRSEIEKAFGRKLDWNRLDTKRACRIMKAFKGIGYRDEDQWGKLQHQMVDSMIQLEKALRPHIGKLKT